MTVNGFSFSVALLVAAYYVNNLIYDRDWTYDFG